MRLLLAIIAVLIPSLVLAQDVGHPLNFAPSADDISVTFLSTMFGIVDGVLYGTGSQIMGQMFSVFNAAVLSLGGIILIYTTIVSTINTAHEGEFLGKKWSSIWVPMRTAVGVALLMPKATGYSLIQIFIMWVVVQGIGAANRLWDATLDYLHQGGVIINSNIDENTSDGETDKVRQAKNLLMAQVCMVGLQDELMRQRNRSGTACPDNPRDNTWCVPKTRYPRFLGIDLVSAYNEQKRIPGKTQVEVPLPYFKADNQPFAELNGICGTLKWNLSTDEQKKKLAERYGNQEAIDNLLGQLERARALAVQQMFLDLSTTANMIVDNGKLGSRSLHLGQKVGEGWSAPDGSVSLLNGRELLNSARAYRAIMGPVLLQLSHAMNGSGSGRTFNEGSGWDAVGALGEGGALPSPGNIVQAARDIDQWGRDLKSHYGPNKLQQRSRDMAFINDAKQDGWLLAGSYFFNLAVLDRSDANLADELKDDGSVTITDASHNLDPGPLRSIDRSTKLPKKAFYNMKEAGLIRQYSFTKGLYENVIEPTKAYTKQAEEYSVKKESKFAFPDLSIPSDISTTMRIDTVGYKSYKKGFMNIPGMVATLMHGIFATLSNIFIVLFNEIIQPLFNMIITPIFQGVVDMFGSALKSSFETQTNPILALARFGNQLIHHALMSWIMMIGVAAQGGIPLVGQGINGIMAVVLPALMTWAAMLFTAGVFLAYYIPLVPYIIFTLGGVAWFIAVIEAMVAAPLVALGITYPSGDDTFGKAGEQSMMLLFNVFLRPAMMILGFISAIILSYVSMWLINAGFSRATRPLYEGTSSFGDMVGSAFIMIIYVAMVVVVIQHSFSLIHRIPDRILRWLSGGVQESLGGDTAGMEQAVRGAGSQGAQAMSKGLQASQEAQSEKAKAEDEAAGQTTGEGTDGPDDGGDGVQQAGAVGGADDGGDEAGSGGTKPPSAPPKPPES